MTSAPLLDDDELQKIYVWVDSVPLSRPKRNIARDFSDGVLVAELLYHYFPKLVELHNYSPANSVRQKLYNWATLNQRVLRRLDFEVKRPDVEAIVNCKPGIIEAVLMQLQQRVADYRARKVSPTSGDMASPGAYEGLGGSLGGSASHHHSAPQQQHRSEPEAAVFASYGAAARAASTSPTATAQLPQPILRSSGAGHHPASSASSAHAMDGSSAGVLGELAERDATISELREHMEILELKVKKLEQLVRLKDSRIQTLTARLQAGAPAGGQ